jgi:tetratricopeptide (TPR) repeat protein
MNKTLILTLLPVIIAVGCSHSQGKINPEAIKLNNDAMALHSNPIYRKDGRNKLLNDAIMLLDSATKIDTNYYVAYYNKLGFQYQLKQYAGALKTAKQMIRLRPRNIDILATMGMLSEQSGDTISSKAYYKKGLSMYNQILDTMDTKNSHYSQFEVQKASFLILLNKQAEANTIFKMLSEREKNPDLKQKYLNLISTKKTIIVISDGPNVKTTQPGPTPITH